MVKLWANILDYPLEFLKLCLIAKAKTITLPDVTLCGKEICKVVLNEGAWVQRPKWR